MNYTSTTYSTEENETQGIELLKKQTNKINELFQIIQKKEQDINSLKKEIAIYNGIQNDLKISQRNYYDMKKKFETCQRCLTESENNYNEILNKCNNLSLTLKNFSQSYQNFENQKEYINRLKNDNIRFQKELNQKSNRIEFLIGKDKVNLEKISFLKEKENKHKEKIHKLKSKINELTFSNQDILNQKSRYENDLTIKFNKYNPVQNSTFDRETNNNEYNDILIKYQAMEDQLVKLTNENSKLIEINKQNEKIIENINKQKDDFENNMNNILKEYSQELSSLINLTKTNIELVKNGNIDKIKQVVPSNNLKEQSSSMNILIFSNLNNIYDEIINFNSYLKNLNLNYKNEKYELEINKLKNELNSFHKSIDEYEERSKKSDLNFKNKTNQLKDDKEKLELQIKSINLLISESFKKISEQFNLISTTDEFPDNLKINKFQDNGIKEMIMDYEKILNNLIHYTKILINDKKRLIKLGEKSDECEKEVLLIKKELEEMKTTNLIPNNKNLLKNNNEQNKNNQINLLTQQLNKKTEELEKLMSNYNLLYCQYHLLLGKENKSTKPNSNRTSSKNTFY